MDEKKENKPFFTINISKEAVINIMVIDVAIHILIYLLKQLQA